jgi:hypothetical protein
MYAQVEKPKKSKSRAVANSVAQKKSNVKQGFGFVDNRPESIAQRKMQSIINSGFHDPIQLMKKWTGGGGFENIEEPPVGGADKTQWLKYMYEGEELYINCTDMASFEHWADIVDIEGSDVGSDEEFEAAEEKSQEDEFPDFKVGEVTSITTIKESSSDHQYVIVMVKGGGNIKMHYGSGGGLYDKSDDIDNQHGIPVTSYSVPSGLTGDTVTQVFESTKETIGSKFTGGNCGACAAELVGKLG